MELEVRVQPQQMPKITVRPIGFQKLRVLI